MPVRASPKACCCGCCCMPLARARVRALMFLAGCPSSPLLGRCAVVRYAPVLLQSSSTTPDTGRLVSCARQRCARQRCGRQQRMRQLGRRRDAPRASSRVLRRASVPASDNVRSCMTGCAHARACALAHAHLGARGDVVHIHTGIHDGCQLAAIRRGDHSTLGGDAAGQKRGVRQQCAEHGRRAAAAAAAACSACVRAAARAAAAHPLSADACSPGTPARTLAVSGWRTATQGGRSGRQGWRPGCWRAAAGGHPTHPATAADWRPPWWLPLLKS